MESESSNQIQADILSVCVCERRNVDESMCSSRMSVRLLLKGRTGFYQVIENFNSEQISSYVFNFSHTVKLLSIIHPDFQNVNIVHQHNIQYVLLPVCAFRRMESPVQKARKINQNHVKNRHLNTCPWRGIQLHVSSRTHLCFFLCSMLSPETRPFHSVFWGVGS